MKKAPRPIDANALVRKKQYTFQIQGGCFPKSGHFINVEDIFDAPTLDYAPVVHGEWVTIESAYWRWKHDGAYCVSRKKFKHEDCGKVVAKKEPYCPKCGARMNMKE